MKLIPRPVLQALPITATLTLALTVAAAAQVATLVDPDETPEPETIAATVEFADADEALLAYAQCLRDNGIDVDDPSAGSTGPRAIFRGGSDADGPGFDRRSEEFIAANESCGQILEASRPEVDPAAEAERLEEQLALAQCIREQGFDDYPDPAIGSDGRLERLRGQGLSDTGIDRRSPEFQAAIGVCRDELGLQDGPGFGGGFGGGAGNGGS